METQAPPTFGGYGPPTTDVAAGAAGAFVKVTGVPVTDLGAFWRNAGSASAPSWVPARVVTITGTPTSSTRRGATAHGELAFKRDEARLEVANARLERDELRSEVAALRSTSAGIPG